MKFPCGGLVEFVLRGGDIISGFSSSTRNLEGTRLHQKLQKAEKEGYEKEHPFQKTIPLSEDVALTVQGPCRRSVPAGRRQLGG